MISRTLGRPSRWEDAASAAAAVIHTVVAGLRLWAGQPLATVRPKAASTHVAVAAVHLPQQAKSTVEILRSLAVFRACRIQPLVTHADSVIAWSKRVLGARLTNFGIRHSFYAQFVAGESIEACAATLRALGSLASAAS